MFKHARSLMLAVVLTFLLATTTLAASEFVDPSLILARVQKTGLSAQVHLGVPDAIQSDLDTALSKLNVAWAANQLFDLPSAVYTYSDSGIDEIAVPLMGAGTSSLSVTTFSTPGDGLAAKILGAVYAPALSASPLVVAYIPSIDQLRFYTKTGAVVPAPVMVKNKFVGLDGQTTEDDTKALISPHETCFPVALDQICFLLTHPTPGKANLVAGSGSDAKSSLYDVWGDSQRAACASALKNWQPGSTTPDACAPSAITAGLTEPTTIAGFEAFRLVGYLSVFASVRLDTKDNPTGEVYNARTGNKVDYLPAGTYTLFNTNPSATLGMKFALLLIGANGNAFYIPARHVEGIAVRDNSHLKESHGSGCSDGSCFP